MVCVFGSFVIGDPLRILDVFGLGLAGQAMFVVPEPAELAERARAVVEAAGWLEGRDAVVGDDGPSRAKRCMSVARSCSA
jgi:hypothetical protein